MPDAEAPPVEPGTDVVPAPPIDRAAAAALAQRDPSDLIMSDDELRRIYREAEALALSGAWKDIKKAEQAFAKIVIGRDLGMTPAASMQGIYIVDGGIQMHYAQLAQFVRSRPGYDFRAGWIKRVRPCVVNFQQGEPEQGEIIGETTGAENARVFVVRFENGRQLKAPEGSVEVLESVDHLVWMDEEEPLDDRPVFGAVGEFTINGRKVGLSRYTLDDARRANLIKADARAAWNTSHRNMLLARMLSNGVKWIVSEVSNGIPIYAPGELNEARPQKSLTAPADEGAGDEGTGMDLGPKVEEIIAEATELGHRGLSNRGAVELAVGQRAPGVVNQWAKDAKAELARFRAEKAAAAEAPETDVAAGDAEEHDVPAPEETVSGPVEPPPAEEEPEPPAEDADVVEDDPQARLDAHLTAEDEAAGLDGK